MWRWDDPSQKWLDELPERMQEALLMGADGGLRSGLQKAVRVARQNAPYFEGEIRKALGFWMQGRTNWGQGVRGYVGFPGPGRIWMDDIDVVEAPTPFNYAWAKEKADAAETHTVMLYNPRTGGSTKGRAKLVRWLKQKYGGLWNKLPDEPTKETWNNKPNDEAFPPPFVEVSPAATATDYITGLISNGGDPLASWIIESVEFWEPVRRAWEA